MVYIFSYTGISVKKWRHGETPPGYPLQVLALPAKSPPFAVGFPLLSLAGNSFHRNTCRTIFLIVLLLFTLGGCNGQNNKNNMNTKQNNPLLCNPENGLCEMPATVDSLTGQVNAPIAIGAKNKPIKIIYFTDPICSSCWGIEPQLRKMKLEYGDSIEIEYHMGGLLPSWDIYNSGSISKPSDVAHHWDEVSRYYQMPIDGDVWLKDPLASSYPPSIAFKAAELQDRNKALLFLRKMREMVFVEGKNIAKWEHIAHAALYAKLDTAQLKTNYEGKAKTLFEADLNLAKQMGVRGFPTLFFSNKQGDSKTISGFKPYTDFETVINTLSVNCKKKNYETAGLELFKYYSTLCTREFAELKSISISEAEIILNQFLADKKIEVTTIKNGKLWSMKKQLD